MADFHYQPTFERGEDATEYRSLGNEGIDVVSEGGRECIRVSSGAIAGLAAAAIRDIQHLLRTSHLEQLRAILDDPEASNNDRYVAYELLRNAAIASGGILPGCQDTGTAIVMAHRGVDVRTDGDDAEAISKGIFEAYRTGNLRYSQVAPLDMYTEKNTGTNLPAQIDVYAEPGNEYHFLFMAKGGGSANKTFLFQETKALLNPDSLLTFVENKLGAIGTSACPPYHLALVVGGTSAEMTLKTVKLASARYLDGLPTSGNEHGRAFRDRELEEQVFQLCREIGVGAQFGGKYFAHDVRVIRLPRHGASCPVGLGVSCSADRQALAKITPEGIFLEKLESDPARFLPDVDAATLGGEVVHVDLRAPMDEVRSLLSGYPVATRVSLNGPLIVARDIAHARLKERVDRGEGLPDYFCRYPVYYAGPAKTPEGYASGSFGPTTAGRMDPYVDLFQQHGGSLVMLAKGNRSDDVRRACQRHGGFYLGSIGGPAARLAEDCIRKVDVVEYEELGMEAIWRIEVEDFPAFIVVDDKGNDFYADLAARRPVAIR